MEIDPRTKYKSELAKISGLSLMIPLGTKIMALLNTESININFDSVVLLQWFFAIILFVAGFILVNLGLVMVDNNLNHIYNVGVVD